VLNKVEIQAKTNCPLDGFKPCRQLECAWFLKIAGRDANTGKEIEDWGCAMAWMPILTIENSNQQRSTSAAVESFRNEMVRNNEVGQRVLLAAAGIAPQTQNLILEG
jgi:hypothetical protein